MNKIYFALIILLFAQTLGYSQQSKTNQSYWDSIPDKIAALKTAIAINPADTLFYHISELYYQLGGKKEGKVYAIKALQAPVRTKYYDHVISGNYIAACNLKCGLEIMRKSIGDTIFIKNNIPVYYYHLKESIITHENILRDFKDTLDVWLKKTDLNDYDYAINARDSYTIGNRQQAFRILQVGIRKYPNSHWLYYRKGIFYLWEGKYKRSIKNLKKAIELTDTEAKRLLYSANMLLSLKKGKQ